MAKEFLHPPRKRSARRLSLVMPAWNEEAGIVQALTEAHESLSELGYRFEIIVVDDGSTDRTGVLVEEIAAHVPEIRLIQHPLNRGYGAALRTGFENARYECVAFTDADAQFYLEDLERMMPLTRSHAVVVGYRENRQDPWRRRFFSWGYNRLVRTLLGTRVRDCDCALKIFRREVLHALMPESRGFFVNAEMLCRANRLGLKIAEVAVRHRARRKGESTVSLSEIPKTLARLIPFWWSNVVCSSRPQPLVWPMVEVPSIPVPEPMRRTRRKKKAKVFRPKQPR